MPEIQEFDSDLMTHDNFFTSLEKKLNPEQQSEIEIMKFLSLKDLLKTEFPKEEWLLDRFIPRNGLVCLSGLPGSYKTWLTHYLALCVLQGKPFLDKFNTIKSNILFIDKENRINWIQKRFQVLGATGDMEGCFFLQGNFSTDSLSDLAKVVAFIKDNDIGLVIIDSLIRVHSRAENDAVEMNKVFERLRELQLAGAAVLFTHHHRKVLNSFATASSSSVTDQLRGTTDILAVLDSHFAVTKTDNFIQITQGKSRHEELLPAFLAEFKFEEEPYTFNFVKQIEGEEVKRIVIADEIIKGLTLGNNLTRDEIIDNFKEYGSRATIDRILKQLETEQRVISYQNGKKKVYCVNHTKSFLSSLDETYN